MLIASKMLTRRVFCGASAALSLAAVRPARAEPPKFKTVEDGYITIAMSGTMPVTGWQDDKLTGSDAMMVQAIAEKLGLKAKPAIMAWSATIQAIRSGRADIMCGDMGWTKARADAMLLTDAIYYGGNFVTMTKEKPFTTSVDPNDLKGATIGSGTGYSYVPDLKKIPGVKDVKLYDNVDSCIRDLIAGRLDYAVLDSMTIDYMLLQQPNLQLKQVPVKPNSEYPNLTGKGRAVMGMSMENPDLFDAVNAGVKWLWDTKKNAEFLALNGMTSPDYLSGPEANTRIGVDRDAAGAILGPAAHTPKDFSALFA
jgi:polar amino acid transport system substrate-binding protein